MTEDGKKTILLVEDEAIISLSEKRALERYGYRVQTAADGESAVAFFARGSAVDLVLMDINLGDGIDGTEASRLILMENDLPIVFLSSHAEPEIVERTEKITSYGYILKNSSITVLDASIKMAFKLFEANSRITRTMNKLEATVGALPDLLFEFGLDGRYYDCHSPRADLLVGPISELLGKKVPDVLPPEVSGVIMSALQEAHQKGSSIGKRYALSVPSGLRWFEISASQMASGAEEPHFMMLCRDISERKQLEERYVASNEMFQAVLDSIPQYLCWKDRESRFLGCNKNHSDLFGFPDTKAIIGKSDWDIHRGKAEIESYIRDDREVMGSDAAKYHIIERTIFPDGRQRWHDTNKVPLHDADGRVNGIMIAYTDITDKKGTEDSLAREQYMRETLMDSSSDFIFFKDLDSKFILVNKAMLAYFGLGDPSEIIGKTDFDFFPAALAQRKFEDERRILNTGAPLIDEEEEQSFAGRNAWVLTQKWPLLDKDGSVIGTFGFSRDITERKGTEKALAEEQYLFQTLLDTSSDHIYFKDRESRFLRTSRAHARFVGLSDPKDMVGKTDFDFFTEVHAAEAYRDEQAVIDTGESIRKEETNIRPSERSTWVLTEKLPLKDKDGRVVGTFGISRDISDRKQSEVRVKALLDEKELVLKEVHHRVKNYLTVISNLVLLQLSTTDGDGTTRALKEIESRIQSISVLYERLYQSPNFDRMSIRAYLPALVARIIENFPAASKVRVEESYDDIVLGADKLQPLGLIVNELLTNIMKYAFAGRSSGLISLSARRQGDIVSLAVQDDGIGLPKEIDFKNSTGLGLMLVENLTGQLKGTIKAERQNGTKIILEFEGTGPAP